MTSAELQVIISAKDQASAQINKLGGSLGGLGSAAKAAGIAFAAIGAGITAIGGMALNAAAEYEAALSSIKAVSGATGEEIKALDALAMKLGKDTVFSAKEAANGIEELLKGGVSIEDVLNGAADAALNLATAGGVGLAEAAEITANALAMFGLKGADAAKVADQIAGAANASSLSVSDFRLSMAAAGAVAALTGQSFEDMAVAIALMGKAGIKGSDAGTSLKTMLMNLQPTTKTGAAVMKQYGIITAQGTNQFIDAKGAFKGINEIAGILNETLGDLSESEQAAALQAMFGSDAIRAAAIMMKAGTKGAEEMAAAMNKVKAADVAAGKLDNLKGSLTALSGSWDTLLITLGKQGTGPIRGAVDWLNNLLGGAIEAVDGKGFVGGLITTLTGHIGRGDWTAVRNTLGTVIGDGLGKLGEFITPYLPDWVQVITGSISKGDWSTAGATLKNKIGEGLGATGEMMGAAWVNIKAELAKPLSEDVKAGASTAGQNLGKAFADAIKGGAKGTGGNPVGAILGEIGEGLMLAAKRGGELGESFISGFQAATTAAGITPPTVKGLEAAAEQSGKDWMTSYIAGMGTQDALMKDYMRRKSAEGTAVSAETIVLTLAAWSKNIENAYMAPFKIAFAWIKGAAEALAVDLGKISTGIVTNFGRGLGQTPSVLLPPSTSPQGYPINYPNNGIAPPENAVGGIIDSPMLTPAGWMGEAGPEALIPLDKLGDMMGGSSKQSGRSPLIVALDGIIDHVGDWTSSVVQVVKEEKALLDGVKALKTSVDSGTAAVKQYQAGFPLAGNFPGGKIIGRESFKQENTGELGTYYTDEWRAIFEDVGKATGDATKNITNPLVTSTATVSDLIDHVGANFDEIIDHVGETLIQHEGAITPDTDALIDHEGAINVVTGALGVLADVAGAAAAAWNAVSGGSLDGSAAVIDTRTAGESRTAWQTYQNPSGDFGGGGGYTPGELAAGGIVTRPGLFQVGEAGPEAVIPLGQLDRGGVGSEPIHITLQINPGQMARLLRGEILELNRLGGRA
jgi:TP901 family phage tail tape measure protein